MKFRIVVLALLGTAGMAAGAFAQSFHFEHRGRHHRLGFSFNLSNRHHRSYRRVTYVQPYYGYHRHHVESTVTPRSSVTTTYDHSGPLHAPSRVTTYVYPRSSYSYYPRVRRTYYYRR